MNARTIAITAVMIAITAAITASPLRVPSGIGYGNLSDVFVMFAAFSFGPMVGFATGGIGAGIADLIGFPPFAPLTFLAHGLEGLVAGYLGSRTNSLPRMLLAWAAGSVVMIAVYFFGELLVPQLWGGAPQAFADLLTDVGQAGLGLIGVALALLVRKAYPPITQMVSGPTWVEEK